MVLHVLDEYLHDKIQNLQFIQIYIMYHQTHAQTNNV